MKAARMLSMAILPASTSAIGAELAGFDCLIEPHAMVEVSTRETGTLEELLVDRGDLVDKGQELARLESRIEKATVALAKGRSEMEPEIKEKQVSLEFARRELARTEELFQKKALSFHEQDKASTEVLRAELQLDQAKQRKRIADLELQRSVAALDARTIRSPIKGVVVARLLFPGESVENRPIIKLAQLDPLNVEVIIPAEQFGSVSVGMRAEVVPKFRGPGVNVATVTVVDRVVDAASNTFGVRLEFPNAEHEIPSGVRCDIRFLSTSKLPAPLRGVPPSPHLSSTHPKSG